MSREKIALEQKEGGAIWHVFLDDPKANVLDAVMTESLTGVFQDAKEASDLKVVVLEGVGDHFSFGASVEEHRPDHVEVMLRGFHGLFRTMADTSVVVLAAVRGQCLGGGLELASFAHRIFASPEARLGQPEIRLGVFAPAASVLLPERLGRPAAEDLCLTGRVLTGLEAGDLGLVDVVAEDPTDAALTYARDLLLPHSAAALRRAVRAVRLGLNRRLREDLNEIERIYLRDLMRTADATEGIEAFLEKRRPVWRNA